MWLSCCHFLSFEGWMFEYIYMKQCCTIWTNESSGNTSSDDTSSDAWTVCSLFIEHFVRWHFFWWSGHFLNFESSTLWLNWFKKLIRFSSTSLTPWIRFHLGLRNPLYLLLTSQTLFLPFYFTVHIAETGLIFIESHSSRVKDMQF